MSGLGRPRRHLRETPSTSDRARALAIAGAPHGTLVTAAAQTAGRGRHGRGWAAPAGQALLLSLVLRRFDRLLPLRAGLAVAEVAGPDALIKWPNDVLVAGRKVAGVLAEASADELWAVLGIGVNVSVDLGLLPATVRHRAGTLGRPATELEPVLGQLLPVLARRLDEAPSGVLEGVRRRDALSARPVSWRDGRGTAVAIADDGALIVAAPDGRRLALDGGEVHLLPE